MKIGKQTYELLDDGTMDTVVSVTCDCGCEWTDRFAMEVARDYRDETGAMVRFKDFINDWGFDEPCLDCGE